MIMKYDQYIGVNPIITRIKDEVSKIFTAACRIYFGPQIIKCTCFFQVKKNV